jgi:hypothetical protein
MQERLYKCIVWFFYNRLLKDEWGALGRMGGWAGIIIKVIPNAFPP